MNKLLKRGFNAYKIILKNKLACALMMLVSGAMMVVAALNNRGNDTKTLPILITAAGVIFSFWAFYRIGYIKSNYDRLEDKLQKTVEKHLFVTQILEALAYIVITVAGIFLLLNEHFVNLILNLMAGGFTLFNGVNGLINVCKRRENKDYRWVIRLILTIFELGVGTYYIISSSSIDTTEFLIMGILTTLAGIIEIVSVSSAETFVNTVKDGKEIVRTLKNDKKEETN